jgi:hypothetical protein
MKCLLAPGVCVLLVPCGRGGDDGGLTVYESKFPRLKHCRWSYVYRKAFEAGAALLVQVRVLAGLCVCIVYVWAAQCV